MKVLETRRHLSCRIQIAEHCAQGWTVLVYSPGQEGPATFRSEEPASLPNLLAAAEAKAAEFEAMMASGIIGRSG